MTGPNRGCWVFDSDSHYGRFPAGHDPRAFSPDPEQSSLAERDAHQRAWDEWQAGRRVKYPAGAFGFGAIFDEPARWDPNAEDFF